LIGRFSATAKLDLFNRNYSDRLSTFQWYEFKFGDKRAGELLAVFELIEVNPVKQSRLTFFSQNVFIDYLNRKHEKLNRHLNLQKF
jgi:hypothetical protein